MQTEKRFVVLEGSWPDSRLDDVRESLIEQLVQAHDSSTGDTAFVALLRLEIEETLRLAE